MLSCYEANIKKEAACAFQCKMVWWWYVLVFSTAASMTSLKHYISYHILVGIALPGRGEKNEGSLGGKKTNNVTF